MTLPNPFDADGYLSRESAAMVCSGEAILNGHTWQIRWQDPCGLGAVVSAADWDFHGLGIDKTVFHSSPYFVTKDHCINHTIIATDSDHEQVVVGYIYTELSEEQKSEVPEAMKIDTTLEEMTILARSDMTLYGQTLGKKQLEITKQFLQELTLSEWELESEKLSSSPME